MYNTRIARNIKHVAHAEAHLTAANLRVNYGTTAFAVMSMTQYRCRISVEITMTIKRKIMFSCVETSYIMYLRHTLRISCQHYGPSEMSSPGTDSCESYPQFGSNGGSRGKRRKLP